MQVLAAVRFNGCSEPCDMRRNAETLTEADDRPFMGLDHSIATWVHGTRRTLRSTAAAGRALAAAAPTVSVFLRRLLLCHCSRARHVLQCHTLAISGDERQAAALRH